MGNLRGHVTYGTGFLLIGLWHLINHTKLHTLNPESYTSLPWFPTSRIRFLELFFIMAGSITAIVMELFIGLLHHQPLDPDGSIPSSHLHNFEHSVIALSILMYGFFAILLDKLAPPAQYGLTNLIGSVAFAMELLIFHLHSTDHMGVEGQYHWLLQIVIFTSLATTLLSINYPESFLISFVRSLSILFQGVWFINIGFMLWTPGLIPKGCFMSWENGYYIVRCHGEEALERAKSLVNIQFSYYVVGLSILAATIYLVMFKFYSGKVEYQSLTRFSEKDEENDDDDDEAKKLRNATGERQSFLRIDKSFAPMDMEM
ncbi:hypothetical protein Pfo_007538 [Paulownia fortunei]|nr:hypothetical protein Pfo_007538 [Paulownia fortunei]